MRKLMIFVLFCVAMALAVTLRPVAAGDSSSEMSSMPPSHNYMLGTWDCTVKLAAMAGNPATTDHGKLTVSVAPAMTLRSHVQAKDYMSDGYEGYDSKTKTHWITNADTTGIVSLETSKDGKVFIGTSWEVGTATPTRDTRSMISQTKIRDITELEENGKWSQIANTICTKS